MYYQNLAKPKQKVVQKSERLISHSAKNEKKTTTQQQQQSFSYYLSNHPILLLSLTFLQFLRLHLKNFHLLHVA